MTEKMKTPYGWLTMTGICKMVNNTFASTSAANKHQHSAAWEAPIYSEIPIVHMVQEIARYADIHEDRFGSSIGEDYVLGPHWLGLIRCVEGLLDGDCGRLDCGTISHMLNEMRLHAGFDEQ